ncbi:hypothetical protein FHT21_001611 [Pedobacter sp. SG908]|nr:hypothetical protein [Pedobacter sp. SG908]
MCFVIIMALAIIVLVRDAVDRNNQRSGKEKVPEIGIRGTFKKLSLPSINESFDELYM